MRLPSGARSGIVPGARRGRPAAAPHVGGSGTDRRRRPLLPRLAGSRRPGRRSEALREAHGASRDELVFVPLGGLGEIGMNAALYGFGPQGRRQWILVDCGMGFAGEEHLPGVDLVYPGSQLYRGRAARTCSASSSRMPTRITSARSPSCGRASARRSTRRASPSASSRRAGSPSPARRRSRCTRSSPAVASPRAVRHRVRAGRPLDPGIERARHPHAARRSSCIRATGSSTTRRMSAAPRTSPGSARSATRACWRSSAIPPTSSATAAARARATSRSGSPN